MVAQTDPSALADSYRKALEAIARGDFNNGSKRQHRSARDYAMWAIRNIGRQS